MQWKVAAPELGRFWLDGGAMFGVVPKAIWERHHPSDEKNRIELSVRSLLLMAEKRVILVDAGLGDFWEPKLRERYRIDLSHFDPSSALRHYGVSPSEVTDVILSHLHFDHVAGAVDARGELFFPNARYYIQAEHLAHAKSPTLRDRASFLPQFIDPLEQSGRLVALTSQDEVAPGVRPYVTHGHTPFHQMVIAKTLVGTIAFCGDTIPTATHVGLPYIAGYDLFPLTTLAEKERILGKAADEKWWLVFVHETRYAAVRVGRRDEGFEVIETSSDLAG